MRPIEIAYLADESPNASAILIGGLPGIGQVGKVAVDHILHELEAEKVAEITSVYFPPQVVSRPDGSCRLVNNEVWRYESPSATYLFLVGDCQSVSPEGHYALADAYLDCAEHFGVKRIFTLGGYGVGHLVDEPRVLSTVTHPHLRPAVEEAGGSFEPEEPGSGIIGAAGMIIALGARRGMEGVCLMGETSGYLVDPKSAAAVLRVLCRLTDLGISRDGLQDRAEDMEQALQQVREFERLRQNDELSYIG
ncbi:MAG: proteasome assembly chaperone family protein [Methanospirillum sp.]